MTLQGNTYLSFTPGSTPSGDDDSANVKWMWETGQLINWTDKHGHAGVIFNDVQLGLSEGVGMTNYPSQTLFVYTNIPMISHEGRYDYTSVASRDLIERGLSIWS